MLCGPGTFRVCISWRLLSGTGTKCLEPYCRLGQHHLQHEALLIYPPKNGVAELASKEGLAGCTQPEPATRPPQGELELEPLSQTLVLVLALNSFLARTQVLIQVRPDPTGLTPRSGLPPLPTNLDAQKKK